MDKMTCQEHTLFQRDFTKVTSFFFLVYHVSWVSLFYPSLSLSSSSLHSLSLKGLFSGIPKIFTGPIAVRACGCCEHQKSACSATASVSLELKRLPPCCNTLIRFPSRIQWVLGKDLTLSGFADISISWGRQGLAAQGCRSSLWKWERVGLCFESGRCGRLNSTNIFRGVRGRNLSFVEYTDKNFS